MSNNKSLTGWVAIVIALLILSGCATYETRPVQELPLAKRTHTQTKANVRVTAAVLSAEESEEAFGLPLYERGIQPIWLKVENQTDESVWFLPTSVDRDYLPPLEVAYMHHRNLSREYNNQMDQYLHDQSMGRYIGPKDAKSGFLFTNLHEGTKIFNVDIAQKDPDLPLINFTFLIEVPGLKPDYYRVDFEKIYAKQQIFNYDQEGLRRALYQLPCCTTNADGSKQGDPLNVVIVGEGEDAEYALIRSGWQPVLGPAARGVSTRHYLFGRPQDVTLRKLRSAGDERNRLRLWLSPMEVDGKPVWIGQISHNSIPATTRDAAKRFRLAADVDEARDYLIQDMLYSQGVSKFGDIKASEPVPMSKQRKTFEGASYFTDGYRTVFWLTRNPVDFEEVGYLEWDEPPTK